MRRPDSALDQMRNTTATAINPSSSSRPPSGQAIHSTPTTTSNNSPRYPHHSPTTPFRSPTDHIPYSQHPQHQQDFFALPPAHQQQQQQRPQYADPSHSPHAAYSPTERRQSQDSSSTVWGQHPPPPPGQYPSLRGDHILDPAQAGPVGQKRTSALLNLSSSQPMSSSGHPQSQQQWMQSPQTEEPGRLIYRGAEVGVMPQFGPPSGAPTYGSHSFPQYMSSMAPPPPVTTRTPPKPSSPTKPTDTARPDPKRSPPSPGQQPMTKRSKTDSTDTAGQWSPNEASPTDSDTKRAMAGMTGTVKTRPVALLSAEQKKANHIHSEQKRRATIRKGYEALCEVVPPLREVVAAGGPGVGAVTTKVPGMSPPEPEKKKGKGKGKKDDDDGGLGGVVKSEALVLTKTIEHVEALLAERNKLLTEHAHLASTLPPHERPPPYVPGQTTSLQPGARELRVWETPWHGGSGLPPPHMRDAMVWMKGLPGDEDDDEDDDDD